MSEFHTQDNYLENEIELVELLGILWRNAWILGSLTLLGFAIAFSYTTFAIQPTYMSESTVYIQPEVKDGSINLNELNTNQRLVATYTQIAKSNTVLTQVVPYFASEGLSVNQIRSMITVSDIRDTQIIKISATTTDPELSARLSNRLVSVFISEITDIMSIDNLRIIDPAVVNPRKVGPNTSLNSAIGALLGLMIAVGFVFLKLMLDRTIHNRSDAEKVLSLPVLGEIGYYND